jgi:hypothetical protein
MGDLAIIPSRSLRPTAMPHGTLVSRESVQEVLDAPMPQVQEVPIRSAQDGSIATLLQDAHVWEEPGADGPLLGAISIKVDGPGPQPDDDVGGPLHDLGVCGTGLGIPGSTAPGDAIPAPRPQVPWTQGRPSCSC